MLSFFQDLIMKVDVAFDDEAFARSVGKIDANLRGKALRAAVNAVAAEERKGYLQDVQQDYSAKKRDFTKKVKTIRARANPSGATAVIRFSEEPTPVYRFGARQGDVGVAFKVSGKMRVLRHAFIAKMPSGHTGVYQRKYKARFPIKEFFTISPAGTMNVDKFEAKQLERIRSLIKRKMTELVEVID